MFNLIPRVMKQNRLNMSDSSQMRWNGITKLRKVAVCSVIGLAGLFIGCSDDDVNPNNNEDEKTETGKITLQLLSGASQSGRIETLMGTRAEEDTGLRKKDKLTWVANIESPKKATESKWSTTAIAFSKDGKRAYITWHSDRQATDKATKWGGTVDVIDITNQAEPKLLGTAVSDSMKFNHVFVGDANLFLAATHARTSGAIARVPLNNGEITSFDADYIGFPGVSVNAVAPYNGELIAVSGHSAGTYATFAQDVKAGPYYYGPNAEKMKTQQANIKIHGVTSADVLSEEALETALSNFGGKYVATEGGNTYVLYNKKGENAKIVNVATGETVTLNTTLKSADKYAETYDFNTGTWIMTEGTKADFYGKHVFAVKGNYAYVACGQNGLRVFDLTTGNETDNAEVTGGNSTHTTGVCIDGDYLYTAGGAGLRIYEIKADGKLLLCAFEVDEYKHDDGQGKPNTNKPATTGNAKRHSPNFVAVNGEYVYIAHGQTGCTVYKFTPTAESTTPAE